MPEIAIKQTLNDASFRRGLAENGANIRNWGKEAQRAFDATRTPLERYEHDLARLDKLHRDGYIGADTYFRRMVQLESQLGRGAAGPARVAGLGPGPVSAAAAPGISPFAGLGSGMQNVAAGIPGVQGLTGFVASGAGVATIAITAAAAAAAKFAVSVKEAAEESRRLALEAQKLDLSIDGFERLSELADDSGTTIQAVGRTIERMAANLGEALQDPTTKAAQSIADMGLNVERLAGMAPEDAFEVIGTAIGSMENKFQRARAEMAIFGKSAQELDLLLRNLAKGGLGEAADTAVSAMDRAILAQFGDHIDHAKDKFKQWLTGVQADVARAFMGEKDWQQIYARVQAPTGMSAADAQAERARRAQAELDKLATKQEGARAAFLKLSPSAEQLAQWDALNAKVEDSGKAGETAAAAIQRMADNVARMRAELAGAALPNAALAQFDATRKYSPADVARLEQELASARIVAPMAQFQGPKQAEANRLQIYELERQLAEAKQEAAQRAKLEQLPGEEAAMQAQLAAQRQADSAVASWEQRLRAATTSADEIAAALIAGSQKFAGNLEAARAFVAEVKAAEKSQAVAKSAEQFEKSMQAEFRAREGETSRQAQLRQLVEGGLSQEAALGLAPMIAQLDAQDKLRARADQLAPNLAYGSREAYDVIARAQAAARAPDRETRLQEESARLLREIKDWLAKIHAKKTPVAEGA